MHGPILLYGTDIDLLETRLMILRQAGLNVVSAQEQVEVEQHAEQCRVGLLVLCHTVGAKAREDAVAALRRHCPEARTLLIVKQFGTPGQTPYPVVNAGDGPARMLAAIQQMLYSGSLQHA